jgi:type III secretion protein V
MNAIVAVRRVLLSGSRYSDVLLSLGVVLVIGLLIVPVPTSLLDALIALNLTMSVVLIVTSMYISNVLSFSTFPSILLFTTLFRLAVDITATRLILLDANAGAIIQTFGEFVVAGNFIVGLVIFLIITIVQFMVITKGAERVSEVSARFTLDAMPGKQMSIDADMRAGVIDIEEARRRRQVLEKENQLFGAMDGAMKFVKGDAIASMIITAINIVAGLAIGMLQKGMDLNTALTTYSILTIGDGLISQIPSLLISITGAIIVTRVSSEEGGGLGTEIAGQILAQPRAILIGAALLIVIGLVPGFPTALFFSFAIVLGIIGFILMSRVPDEAPVKEPPGMPPAVQIAKKKAVAPEDEAEFSIAVPLLIEGAQDLQELIEPEAFNRELARLRRALYFDLGVPFPGARMRFSSELPPGTYRILLKEVPIASGHLRPHALLAREGTGNLDMIGIPYLAEKPFLPKMDTLWIEEAYRPQLEQASIAYLEPPQIMIYQLSVVLKKYAGEFVGLQETKFLLGHLEEQLPEVAHEVQRVLPLPKIADVLSRLVQEEVSIHDLRTILETLIDKGQLEKETILLTEYARASLKRYISYKFSGGQNILPVYLFAPDVEEQLRMAIRQTSEGSYLALDPKAARKLVASIKTKIGDVSKAQQRPALLTAMDVRRYLRKLIEAELYEIPVLSYQELTKEITVQPLGKITMA